MPVSRHGASARLRRSLALITLGGSLCMLFVVGTTSPAQTDFFKTLGAGELFFGLLGGVPMVMLGMQFIGALAANHLARRKPLWMAFLIGGRLLYIPMVLIPLIFRQDSNGALTAVILLVAASSAVQNFASPLWYSWMSDLIPHRVLNRYWGSRERWLNIFWSVSFVALTLFTYFSERPILVTFPVAAIAGAVAGVLDICLFTWVHEPKHEKVTDVPVVRMLLAPLRHSDYSTFVFFSCIWSAAIMFAASFMPLYLLREMNLPVWQVNLLWCVSGVGSALAARGWGRMADKHGQKPVLAICVAFKPLIALVFLLITPGSAMCVLALGMFVDGMLNAGCAVASNGYMMKIAPKQNRSMFAAAIIGLSGICGGLASMAGGVFMNSLSGFSCHLLGRTWGSFHALFLATFFARLACAGLVHRVREPGSSSTAQVLREVLAKLPPPFLASWAGADRGGGRPRPVAKAGYRGAPR